MKKSVMSGLGILAIVGMMACSRNKAVPNDGNVRAIAYMLDTLGRELGRIRLTQAGTGGPVTLAIEVDRGATEGQHGIHFHSVGSCDKANNFAAAGGHFNPTNKLHGLSNPDGPHAGDLEALTVTFLRTAQFNTVNSRITLIPGPTSLFDADGSSIVLHALPDDQRTDPAGSSGARLACGVITKL